MMTADEDWLAAQRLRVVTEYVASAERQFRAQSNPLFAWNAIAHLLARDMPLPPWCLEYLKACACEIDGLAKEVAGYSKEVPGFGWESDVDGSNTRRSKTRLSGPDALASSARALGFLQGATKNMFTEMANYIDRLQDGALMHVAQTVEESGISRGQVQKAKASIKQRRKVEQVSMKRKIREAKRAFEES